jgi:hypothetical protein
LASQVPILRILGGLFFVLAGLAYYLGITIASSFSLLFIAAGAAVLVLALLGHRAHGGDVAVFVIGLLVLGVFITPGVGAPGSAVGQRVSHTVPRSGVSTQQIDLIASADLGSIDIFYSNRSDLGYQVNFTRSSFPFGLFTGSRPSTSLSNETRGGVFTLNATARSYDISLAIGMGYLLNISAATGTGSINVSSLVGERLGTVSLQSGTGSVNANLTSLSIGGISLQAGTGSVNLHSNHLAPTGARVPITLKTGTGSVDLEMKLASKTAVSLEASAGLGNVNHNLQGFSISSQSSRSDLVATAGDINNAATSFVVQLSTGTGSVTVNSQFLG